MKKIKSTKNFLLLLIKIITFSALKSGGDEDQL